MQDQTKFRLFCQVIVLPEEPEEGATDSVSIVLRTFQGRRHTRRFRTSDPVQVCAVVCLH